MVDVDVSAPVAVVLVQGLAPALWVNLDAPLAQVSVEAFAPVLLSATITMVRPANMQWVPSLRPVFELYVTTNDRGVSVEVQYATFYDYRDAVSLILPLAEPGGQVRVLAQVQEDLADEAYYYRRARVINASSETDWSVSRLFYISTAEGDALVAGGWTVDTTVGAVPHIWYVSPARGQEGSTAAVVGTGFGGAPSIVIGSAPDPGEVTDNDIIAPSGDATTADRRIDAQADVADPGHQRLTFTVPDVDPPGGPLYVETP